MRDNTVITVSKGGITRRIPTALLGAFENRGYVKITSAASAPPPAESKASGSKTGAVKSKPTKPTEEKTQ